MKIRHFDIVRIVLYPSIFNPFVWILLLVFILYMMFVAWWKTELDYEGNIKYLFFKLDADKWRRAKCDLLSLVSGIVINTFWWNRERTIAYADYLEEKYFPTYPNDDYTRGYYLEIKYNKYLTLSGKLK